MRNFRLSILIIGLVTLLSTSALEARHFARWFTTMGSFTADLRDEIMPITANNFIDLTNDGFYDGLHFHRVIEDFMIQDGDPNGNGTGGPGYTIADESSPLLLHDSAGVLAMARTSAPHSAGSQYYITLAPTPWLDGGYAAFGKVFQGLDVVMAIGSVATDDNDHPIDNVYIDSLRVLNMVINAAVPPVDTVAAFNTNNPYPFILEAYGNYANIQFAWYIDDVLQGGSTELIFEPNFTSPGMHVVKCITSDTELEWTTTWQVNVTGTANDDQNMVQPKLKIISLYPNPVLDRATLVYSTKAKQAVQVSVYDLKGRLVKTEKLNSKTGNNQWSWDRKDANKKAIPAGIYLIRLSAGTAHSLQKAIVLR
jgi:cyclophilin family peptidyl-prolyl cis-trans isomerase